MADKPLREGTDEHPRRTDDPKDPYGTTGAKKVPSDKKRAEAFMDRPNVVRSKTGEVE